MEHDSRTVLEVDADGQGKDGVRIAAFAGVSSITSATVDDLLLGGNLVVGPVTS